MIKKQDTKSIKSKKDTGQLLDWATIPEYIHAGVEALKDKKVEDIRVYDMRGFTPFCDYVLLGTVMSAPQAKVAYEEFGNRVELREIGVEGDESSKWLLVDYWDVVLHLFRPETREYYNLEALWADLPWWPGEIEV